MKYIVKKHEIGLLFKNGSYVKTLKEGVYRYSKLTHRHVVSADLRQKFPPSGLELSLFKEDNALMNMLHIVHVKDNEIALHYTDGNFSGILTRGTHAYFRSMVDHAFHTVNTDDPIMAPDVDASIFAKIFGRDGSAYHYTFDVPAGSVGILLKDGEYVGKLSSGIHHFWKGKHTMEVRTVDLRSQSVEISGQELLSKDKVTLRINFACHYKVTDAVKVITEFEDYDYDIYYTLQMALREFVSTRKLDDLLAEKHEIGRIILATIRQKQDFLGVEFLEAGVKDIILPGDVRDILNTVLVAEKQALAKVITRREETASTRSLLNTAKLMDENHTLYKLKELEYLERICDKVGNISLSSGAGIIEQLTALIEK